MRNEQPNIDPEETAKIDAAYSLYKELHKSIGGQSGEIAMHALVECLVQLYGAIPAVQDGRMNGYQFADMIRTEVLKGCSIDDKNAGRPIRQQGVIIIGGRMA